MAGRRGSIGGHGRIDVPRPGGDAALQVDYSCKALVLQEAGHLVAADAVVTDTDDLAPAIEPIQGAGDLIHGQGLGALDSADAELPGLTNIQQKGLVAIRGPLQELRDCPGPEITHQASQSELESLGLGHLGERRGDGLEQILTAEIAGPHPGHEARLHDGALADDAKEPPAQGQLVLQER